MSLNKKKTPPNKRRGLMSHDAIFKEVYSNKKYSLDIFKLIFKAHEFKLFDWRTLKPEMNVYIDNKGKEKRIDLLFSVRMKGSKKEVKILFLLEHKSCRDDSVFKQLLSYQTTSYSYFEYKYPILPIVFYHGKDREWRGSLNFQDFLKGFHPTLRQYFSRNILNFEPKLLNVHKIDLNLKEHKELLSRPVLLIMSAVWDLDQKIIEEVLKMGAELGKKQKQQKDQSFLIQKIADYIHRVNPEFTFKIIRKIEEKIIPEELQVMSALQCTLDEEREKGIQQGISQGIQQGREEYRAETALRMIQDGLDLKTITLYTGLTPEEVENLQKEDKKI